MITKARSGVCQTFVTSALSLATLVSTFAGAPPSVPTPTGPPPVPPAVAPANIVRPQAFNPAPMVTPTVSQPFTPGQAQGIPATPKRVILVQPPAPAFQPRVATAAPVGVVATNILAWDAESKESSPKVGEMAAEFSFNLTNISPSEVLINSVHTSCGCTVAKLPEQPWRIAPGAGGPIGVTVNLAGKIGQFTKMVTVDTSHGTKTLYVKVNMPTAPAVDTAAAGGVGPGGNNMNRLANMQTALANRQAVFKGECAKCHAEPALTKTGQEVHGKELYTAVCGVCHDSPHRAGMVPDLYTLKHPTDEALWKQWITVGKNGTMMPAFAKSEGGPLSDGQVSSLVKYLMETVTHRPTAQLQTPPIVSIADPHAGHDHEAPVATSVTAPPPLLAAPAGSAAPTPSKPE